MLAWTLQRVEWVKLAIVAQRLEKECEKAKHSIHTYLETKLQILKTECGTIPPWTAEGGATDTFKLEVHVDKIASFNSIISSTISGNWIVRQQNAPTETSSDQNR